MKLTIQTPQIALKAFIKQRPLRSEIDLFKINLIGLLEKIKTIESLPKDETEEHLKNNVRDFLRDTYYKETNEINTKDKKDLVIHLGHKTDTAVGVIIEAKRPSNEGEMITTAKPNNKALWELILYYIDERIKANNNELKHLVVTNIYQWYIIDANYFDKYIYRNTAIKKLYEIKQNDKKDNPWFYEELNKLLATLELDIPCVGFDIRNYDDILRNNNIDDDKALISLYKMLSPQHLLKQVTPNDSNSLNPGFYKELLHIIGLEEAKDGGKNIIRRKLVDKNEASLIEATIDALNTEDVYHRIPDLSIYGTHKEERIFNISLELCITWINRILFLKLLEGQLINYHKGDKNYRFLNNETIHDYDELFRLFHKVLAVNIDDRSENLKDKYNRVPYLNSSLFEISELEDQTIKINSLDNAAQLDLISTTILKEVKKKTNKLPTLNYLQQFLDAYDFASEGTEDVQEDNKTIITASVLGKVFEKINGYKDGSVFTPSFITMYMCRKSIRLSVVQKFKDYAKANELKAYNFDSIEDIKELITNKIISREDANEIINSLKICDPAVGSGHFLVSALNEVIVIKSELNVLIDENGKTLRDYEIEIINDELIITNENGTLFAYNPLNKESNRVQKTLFQEKQTIIENCLFGVDINPNSVKICRLRLWIELLKNAYYRNQPMPSLEAKASVINEQQLETLPNIDINIKCGNSLISRFALDADLSKALKKSKWTIDTYKIAVQTYHSATKKADKQELLKLINEIKNNFRTEIYSYDPKITKLQKLQYEYNMLVAPKIFMEDAVPYGNKGTKQAMAERLKKYEEDISNLQSQIDEIKNNVIYKNAFEWRFEFPEVLSNKGEYIGFDLVIGNPPYIRHEEIKHLKPQLEKDFSVYNSSADLLTYFFELGHKILKDKGELSFIVSNKFFKVSYGEKLRNFIIQNTLINTIIDFDKLNVFDEATVKAAIVQFSKIKTASNFIYLDVQDMPENLEKTIAAKAKEYEQNLFTGGGQWIFQSEDKWKIFHKISKHGVALSGWDLNIYRGLLTGLNEAFLIDEATKNNLIKEDKSATDLIKPLFRGREIEKYNAEFQKTYLIFIPKGYTIKRNLPKNSPHFVEEPPPRYGNMEFDDAWSWLKMNYPSIAKHLLLFKLNAEKRQDKGDYWWELRACDYYKKFEEPKLIWKRIGSKLRFCYDESGTYTLDSTCIATGSHLKYLVGVLNSKLIDNELNRFAPKTGTGDLIISVQALSPLQIPIPTEKQEQEMNTLVDQIILLKQQNKDTKKLETEIDQLVYKLYNLTADDIKIVEGE